MSQFLDVLSVENPAFCSYLTYVCILVLKMMLMAPLTTNQRFKYKACISEEDAKFLKSKVNKQNPAVERVRSCHLNDLENIPIFFLAALAYLFTNPSATLATLLFRTFTICRIIHTFVYAIVVIPQPARGISWAIGYFITAYMAISTILYFQAF